MFAANSSVSSLAVPCEPSDLAVAVDCETNSAVLSWDASEGAVKYFGCAQPVVGGPLYCDSTNASCVIEGLECGGIYNFSVESSDGTCNSSFSAPLEAGAGEFKFEHRCWKLKRQPTFCHVSQINYWNYLIELCVLSEK